MHIRERYVIELHLYRHNTSPTKTDPFFGGAATLELAREMCEGYRHLFKTDAVYEIRLWDMRPDHGGPSLIDWRISSDKDWF